MKKIKCSLGFRDYSKPNYLDFCTTVENGIYNNSNVFNHPPLDKDEFSSLFTKYSDAAAQYKIAPSVEKTNFVNAKKAMDTGLTKTAEYVDVVADGDESIIYLAGFVPTKSTSTKSQPLTEVQIGKTKRGPNVGEITTEGTSVKKNGAISYIVLVSVGAPLPNGVFVNGQLSVTDATMPIIMDASRSRKKVISNLPPGSTVYVYYSASNPVSVSPIGEPQTVIV